MARENVTFPSRVSQAFASSSASYASFVRSSSVRRDLIISFSAACVFSSACDASSSFCVSSSIFGVPFQ
jgi:hypothetical protein